jgi:hypothetical protein
MTIFEPQFFETHELFIDANHRPTTRSSDNATWTRLNLMPFPYRVRLRSRRLRREPCICLLVSTLLINRCSVLNECPKNNQGRTRCHPKNTYIPREEFHRRKHQTPGLTILSPNSTTWNVRRLPNWLIYSGKREGDLGVHPKKTGFEPSTS